MKIRQVVYYAVEYDAGDYGITRELRTNPECAKIEAREMLERDPSSNARAVGLVCWQVE